MRVELKLHIIQLLEAYREREQKIALLHYELEHPARVFPDEMLNSMAFGHGDGAGRSPGHISNKTMYIALNYQEQAEKLNTGNVDEIAAQLVELEREQSRLRYYASLLDVREEEVIRLAYFDGCSWSETAKKIGVVSRTVHRIKDRAIDRLAEMYDFAGGNL